MDRELAHLEVLGPRTGLDGWLATLQEAGTCHLADALVALAGEAGIGRPRPRDEERRAADLRAPVLLALRGLSSVLPAAGAPGAQPAPAADASEWSLPPGGVDEEALAVRCERLLGLARRLRRDLEDAHGAARALEALERARAGVRAAVELAVAAVPARVWTRAGSGGSRLLRKLRARGAQAALGVSGAFEAVALAAAPDADASARLARAGFAPCDLGDVVGRVPAEAVGSLEPRLQQALATQETARTTLASRLAGDGPEARRALEGLEDAEARERAQRLLASTGHVAAARLYVPARSEPDLRVRLERRHGSAVVVRSLAPAEDAPGPVRSLPGSPLAALRGLAPSRFRARSALAVPLLLTVPLAAFLAFDVLVGLVLLLSGRALAAGSRRRTPRRDAARLAQLGGLAGLLGGLLAGRAAGAAGAKLWGTGWALAPEVAAQGWGPSWAALLGFVALVSWAVAVYVLLVAARQRAGGLATGAEPAWPALHGPVLLGFLCAAAAALGTNGSPLPVAGAGVYVLLLLFLLDPRRLGRLALDVLGGIRGVAVACLALFACTWALGAHDDSAGGHLWVVLLATALLVLEAAAAAMGPSYDEVLGAGGAAPEFTPFARGGRLVRARDPA